MKREAEVKELLISNAIHIIAEGGFEKATTKELTLCGGHLTDLKMNEVYIYRFFGSKEKLYESAFRQLDTELYYAFRNGVDAVGGFEQDTKEHLYEFFSKAWNFILGNEYRTDVIVNENTVSESYPTANSPFVFQIKLSEESTIEIESKWGIPADPVIVKGTTIDTTVLSSISDEATAEQ